MANSDVLAKGFPQSAGGKIQGLVKHFGPTSYTVVTPGTPPTGGDSITAAAFGMKFIERLNVVGDNTGTYVVVPIELVPGTTWLLRWFTAATMAEVAATTNLNASYVKLEALGF